MVIARIAGNLYYFETLGELDRFINEFNFKIDGTIYLNNNSRQE